MSRADCLSVSPCTVDSGQWQNSSLASELVSVEQFDRLGASRPLRLRSSTTDWISLAACSCLHRKKKARRPAQFVLGCTWRPPDHRNSSVRARAA
jgi:hypothetical protein